MQAAQIFNNKGGVIMNIYQKIVEVRKSIEGFNKDATGYGYKYVSGSQVLSGIKAKMDELGVVLEPHLTAPVVGQSNKGYIVSSPMKMIWVNSEKPEDRTEVSWFMTGEQKDPSQALGSGLTYTERYFLLKYFGVPTDEDDPDKGPGNGNNQNKNKTTDKNLIIPKIGKSDSELKKELMKKHGGDKAKAEAEYKEIKEQQKKQMTELEHDIEQHLLETEGQDVSIQ
jgi:hypothetical protein